MCFLTKWHTVSCLWTQLQLRLNTWVESTWVMFNEINMALPLKYWWCDWNFGKAKYQRTKLQKKKTLLRWIFSLLLFFKAKLKYVCFPQSYLRKKRQHTSKFMSWLFCGHFIYKDPLTHFDVKPSSERQWVLFLKDTSYNQQSAVKSLHLCPHSGIKSRSTKSVSLLTHKNNKKIVVAFVNILIELDDETEGLLPLLEDLRQVT